jgi:hypothetical protein
MEWPSSVYTTGRDIRRLTSGLKTAFPSTTQKRAERSDASRDGCRGRIDHAAKH